MPRLRVNPGYRTLSAGVSVFVLGLFFQTRQPPPTCCSSDWSEPTVVLPDSSLISTASISAFGRGVYAVGNGDGGKTWTDRGLIAVRIGGAALPQLTGDYSFSRPLLFADTAGQLGLVWGERDVGDREHQVSSLYYAVRLNPPAVVDRDTLYWSLPERLYERSHLAWAGGYGGSVFVSDQNEMHLVTGSKPATYIVQAFGEWRRTMEFLATVEAYVGLAKGGSARLYMPFIAPDVSVAGMNSNSVFFRRSFDGGRTWMTPTLVSRSAGGDGAHQVRLTVSNEEVLHLTWLQDIAGRREIWHAYSTSYGAEWSSPDRMEPQGRPVALAVASDSAGRVHAMYTADVGDALRLFYIVRDRTSWSSPKWLDRQFEAGAPSIAVDGGGVVYALWSRLPEGDPRRGYSVYSTLRQTEDRDTSGF